MSWIQAIFLSIIQGLTEFLPVSSSGHLVIFQKIFRLEEPPVLFDILVHVGTLGAIVFYFRKQLLAIFKGVIKKNRSDINILSMILIGTIPAGIIGFFLQGYIKDIFDSLKLVGLSLLLTAGLLFSTKFTKNLNKDFKHLNWKETLFIGIFQAIAILPGVSRSGSTIVAGLWRNLKRETAFAFSFYLAIPAILGALILQIPEMSNTSGYYLKQGIFGMIVAGIVGYFALTLLERVIKSTKLFWFGFYCFALGVLILLV